MSAARLRSVRELHELRARRQDHLGQHLPCSAGDRPADDSVERHLVTHSFAHGRIESIEHAVAAGGFEALARALQQEDPKALVEAVKRSGLRGRTGGGFPTGLKCQLVSEAADPVRFVVCNGNAGGPGATVATKILEANPFAVIEGLTVAALAVGASQGYVSVPMDDNHLVSRVELAVEQCRSLGLLGDDILGSGSSFDVEIHPSTGALVLSDETALICSIEGRRPTPRPRPPFPSSHGLFGKPTLICQVETLVALLPVLLDEQISRLGTSLSVGSKVLLLSGCIRRPGLIEVEMGASLAHIVHGVGGGPPEGRKIRAVQIGGPSGGLVPVPDPEITLDYEALHRAGASMGSGRLTAIAEDACMVDVVRVMTEQISLESCGKCPPCRIGLQVIVNLVERIAHGEGSVSDLDLLEKMSTHIRSSSLCSLGQSAPNNLLSALRYFRSDFEEHIRNGHCPHGVCSSFGGRA